MSAQVEGRCLSSLPGVWLRGNLHTHTTRSDGQLTPQEAVEAYRRLGHDFLALTDHNLPADLSGLDARGMLLLPGSELSSSDGHILALGGCPPPGDIVGAQETIDAIVQSGGLAVVCHPDWGRDFNHYPWEVLAGLTGYSGIEVYNGSIEEDPGSPCAAGKWDRLLAAGRRCWALATDDCHRSSMCGRGCCVVRAAERSPEAVIEGLRRGDFYASTGATFAAIEVDGHKVRVASPDAEVITVFGELGKRLARVEAPELTFDAGQCPDPFFRVEALARAGRMAWTQPFRLSGAEIDRRRALVEARPTLRVGRAERAPSADAGLDDPAWAKAGATCGFVDSSTAAAPPVETELRALLAGGELHFGLRCAEPRLDRMKLTVTEDGSSNLWTDDGVELFLDVEGRARWYFQLMANAAGRVSAWLRGRPNAGRRPPRVSARAGRGAGFYDLVVRVPLAELGLDRAPEAGARWGFNAVRNRHPEPGSFVFSLTGAGNHCPERFGWLEF